MTPARVGLLGLLLAFAVVLQTTVLSRIPFPRATPDLVLLVVVGIALVLGPSGGAIAGFTGGLMLDMVPPAVGAIGRWALVLCLVGWIAGRLSDSVDRSVFLPLVIVACSSAGAILAYAAIGWVTGDQRVRSDALTDSLPAAVFYDVLLTPFVVPAVMKFVRRLRPTATYARTVR